MIIITTIIVIVVVIIITINIFYITKGDSQYNK